MGNSGKSGGENGLVCPVPRAPDFSGVTTVVLEPSPRLHDHAAAALADAEAGKRLAHPMLLSWYDRDRDFADGVEARAARHDSKDGGGRATHGAVAEGGRDCGFEAPQHVSECHQDSAVPGYVDYALSRGATLRVDVENGRFVFFYRDAAV